ncbi:hypothetical protein IKG16_00955 [Candidatus Saccharibacteria bacterium]|nr:hypothetical protein [Candidatus Saccharibacteria bacterium]
MKKRIISFLSLVAICILGAMTVVQTGLAASGDPCVDGMPAALKEAAGCNGTNDKLTPAIVKILDGIILASGTVAVVFVIVGGVNYMTSAGDAAKIEKAKKTILYAVIGLVICALSYVIVNFVINSLL